MFLITVYSNNIALKYYKSLYRMLYLFNEQTNNAFIKFDYRCIICVMYTIYVGVGGGVIQLGNYGKGSTFGHPECPPLIIIELVSNTS